MKTGLLSYATGRFREPELEFGARWVEHHKRIFGGDNIFVVGNYVDPLLYKDVHLINRNHPEGLQYDAYWELAMLSEWLPKLRNTYYCLFITLMDEFLCFDRPLEEVVEQNRKVKGGVCRVKGYHIVQNIFTEPLLDLNTPTLEQRKWWIYDEAQTHPVIFYSSIPFALGCHSLVGVEPNRIPVAGGVTLSHQKREDFNMYLKRTMDRRTWKWDPYVWNQGGLSTHNKLFGKKLRNWFFGGVESAEPIRNGFLWVP